MISECRSALMSCLRHLACASIVGESRSDHAGIGWSSRLSNLEVAKAVTVALSVEIFITLKHRTQVYWPMDSAHSVMKQQ